MSKLLAICNPLLDISGENIPVSLFQKYGLKFGDAIIAKSTHLPLFQELQSDYKTTLIPGGAGQNTIRAFQWMIQSPCVGAFIGAIGKDDNGKKLESIAKSDGVNTHYYVSNSVPTGTCAVLVNDKERSLVANLGASEKFDKAHFEDSRVEDLLQSVEYIYITGFFLTHSADAIYELSKNVTSNGKEVLINLSAPFLIENYWNEFERILPYTSLIFCNETEAFTLGLKMKWGGDLDTIAIKLASHLSNPCKKRIVVFTQGSKQTIVCRDGKTINHFYPNKVESEQIVDTNGAGDSFVGGFLASYIYGNPIQDCIESGHYCAAECIKMPGCTFPKHQI